MIVYSDITYTISLIFGFFYTKSDKLFTKSDINSIIETEVVVMAYQAIELKKTIEISSVITIHYFEYMKDFIFSGESHDFWEFVYVDKGEVTAITDSKETVLESGSIIFHRPNEWHNIKNGVNASNVVIITFTAPIFPDEFFTEAVLKVNNTQKILLSKILNETVNVFSTPLGDPYTQKMDLKEEVNDVSQQFIHLYLTEFLLHFLYSDSIVTRVPITHPADNTVFSEAVDYMSDNLGAKIKISDIAYHMNISVSKLKMLFRDNVGRGVIDYFNFMKIEAAKAYIREDNHSFSQISGILGYSSQNYFSMQFKKYVGMSPSEYEKSVKSMLKTEQ